MNENQIIQERYRPNKQLERYKAAVLAGNGPDGKKQRAIARYAATLERESTAVEAARAVMDERGVVRLLHRRLADSLAKACAGCVCLTQSEVVERLVEKAAKRLGHGMDEELVFALIARCLEAVGLGNGDAITVPVREQARKLFEQQKAVKPRRAASEAVGSGHPHSIPTGLAEELEQPTESEEFQRKKAVESLKQALCCIKPWARKLVVDRLARRKPTELLSQETGLAKSEVERILAEAREFVRKYTNYFDDEWFWADRCSEPKLLPGS